MRLRGCLNMICENHEGQALFFQKAVEKGDEKIAHELNCIPSSEQRKNLFLRRATMPLAVFSMLRYCRICLTCPRHPSSRSPSIFLAGGSPIAQSAIGVSAGQFPPALSPVPCGAPAHISAGRAGPPVRIPPALCLSARIICQSRGCIPWRLRIVPYARAARGLWFAWTHLPMLS